MEGGAAQQQAELLDSFCGVTSATRDVALFFLESHNWFLDAAIAAFYEHDEYDDRPQPDPNPRSQRRRTRSHDDDEDYKDEAEEEEEDDEEDEEYFPLEDSAPSPPRPATRSTAANRRPPAAVVSRVGEKRPPSKPSGSRSNIRTFADLNRSSGPGSDDDSDEPQEYYTGGEKSGMLVQDPSRANHDVDSIFEQARQMGAMQGPVEPRPSSSRSFTGTGRLLSGETIQSASQQPDEVVHNIYFWSNGFTVNDGPLRSFDDPENAAFLESIKKSECPKELAPADRKTMVNVNLIRKEEKCPEPAKQINLFQGVGRTLSNESSNPSITGTPVASDNTPSVGLSVDSTKPSTSVQLRLADGTRMVARFNTHHTVGDIRAFIDASRPGASRSYHLRTVGFPPKQLNDLMQTIEEAGLANSVIIQHF